MLSYPCGGGEHVLLSELEAVHLLQDHPPVQLALEEVGAAHNGGDALRLVSLDQNSCGGVVGLHTPEMEERRGMRVGKKKTVSWSALIFYRI